MFNRFKAIDKVILSALWLVVTAYGVYYLADVLLQTYQGNIEWQLPHLSANKILLVLALLGLMVLNWSIEASKWKIAINDLEKHSFFKAFKATLVGVAISTWMPNRLGEYLGKIFFVRRSNRFKGAVSALYVSYTQIIATTFFGVIGMIYFLVFWSKEFEHQIGIYLVIVLLALVSFLFLKGYLKKLWLGNKYLRIFVRTFSRYGHRKTLVLIGMSALRFAVYNTQFVLALYLFNLEVQFLQAFLLSAFIYGIQTVIPATALASLGIRGALAVYFIGFLAKGEANILSATYFIWTLNLLFPSIFGLLALIFSPIRIEVKQLTLNWLKTFSIRS